MNQGMRAAVGAVQRFDHGAEHHVVGHGFEHQQAAEHHPLKGPVLEAGKGEGHRWCPELCSPSPRWSPAPVISGHGHCGLAHSSARRCCLQRAWLAVQ